MGSTREAESQNEQPLLSSTHAKDLWEHAEGDEKTSLVNTSSIRIACF